MQRYYNAEANTSTAVQQNLYKLMIHVEGLCTGEQEQQRLKERMREE